MKVVIVLNAGSGSARRRLPPDRVESRARAILAPLGAELDVRLTQRPGHGRALARQAVEDGADVVCAWGGDGTVNEVASALAGGPGVLAVVPAGSGNGFARDLGIPLDLESALAVAVQGAIRVVDAGELNGRLFFSVAGLGFDARVAHTFAQSPRGARGLAMYVWAGLGSLFRDRPHRCTMVADGALVVDARVKLIALANMRQWGNEACVAPDAKPDDGLLDATVVEDRPTLFLLAQVWRLWAGTIGRARGVTMSTFREATIEADADLPLHLDGEPAGCTRRVRVTGRPGARAVRVPRLDGGLR